jgi:hypothetical protein
LVEIDPSAPQLVERTLDAGGQKLARIAWRTLWRISGIVFSRSVIIDRLIHSERTYASAADE